MNAKIDTTLRQWCKDCAKTTVTRRCIYAPAVCCSECCTPCEIEDEDAAWWEDEE